MPYQSGAIIAHGEEMCPIRGPRKVNHRRGVSAQDVSGCLVGMSHNQMRPLSVSGAVRLGGTARHPGTIPGS